MRHVPIGLALAATLFVAPVIAQEKAQVKSSDPFIWLEDVEGERALGWVKTRNAGTLAELTRAPVYQPIFDEVK
ncbi:MAG TPA: hypothetical protein VK864_05810, partial [Longimicrobiales bacterium]|nr:hypothetical protein [Longimicrobiales bacterium]